MLDQIENRIAELRKSERKVAQLVLSQPNTVLNESLAVLAEKAEVSEPTVIRFCRAVGCKGFQDFKLRLAKSLATGVRYFHSDVSPTDPPADVVGKVFDRALATLSQVRNNLSIEALEEAIGYLLRTDRIEVYGVAASSFVAHHAQHKFFRLGTPVAVYDDPHFQTLAAASLEPRSVVVSISQSGENLDLLSAVEAAKHSGAVVISITMAHSSLAKMATVNLAVDIVKETALYAPITEYLAHLTLIDVLAVGVAVRRGPDLLRQLAEKRRALFDTDSKALK